MKKALVTMVDDNFMIGFKGFYKSFIYHNKWFLNNEIDLVILDNGLSEESKNKILEYNENTKFRSIKKDNYRSVRFEKTADHLKSTYYKLDVFSIREYSKIIFIDSDVTVLRDIKELFDVGPGFWACRTYSNHNDRLNRSINSGVFVVSSEHLRKSIYSKLINISKRGHTMPDQKTINIFFGPSMRYLKKEFNVEKRMWKSEDLQNIWRNKAILHWVANKPWMKSEDHQNDEERTFFEIYPVWWEYYNMTWEEIIG